MGEQDILSFGGGGNGMESKRLIDPVQIGGNLGILVGLIFVGLQIQQDRELKGGTTVQQLYLGRTTL